MFRKHTRRAAKAAFAISFGVALLIGLTAAVEAAAQYNTTTAASGPKPAITVGTKNFAEEFILGQLYGQALAAKGFKVTFKNNIGSSEVIDTAIKKNKINFYPEYTGVIAARPRGQERAEDGDGDLPAAKTSSRSAGDAVQADAVLRQRHLHDAHEDGARSSASRRSPT